MQYDFTTVLNRFGTGSTKWEEMKKYGITDSSIVPLSNAEMEFDNAPEIKQGLIDYIGKAVLSYFDPQPDYFETVKTWFERRYNFCFDVSAVVPNPSIHAALCTAIMAYSNEGDGILVMQPTWPGFLGSVRNTGRKIIDHELVEQDCVYSIDFERLEAQLSAPECKMILLCSPHNPVGRCWTKDELTTIGELCVKHDVIIVSDEIHADLTMPGYRHYPIATLSPEIAARTVTFTGASKAFNLAGLDTSNVIITDEALRTKFRQARRKEGFSDPNMIGLKALELAYTKGESWLRECVDVIAENARYVTEFLREEIPQVRCTRLEATYLMWLDFRQLGLDEKELEKGLMEDAHLFMDDGYYFGVGGSRFVRMNIACPKAVLVTAMGRMRDWVRSLPKE